jgi:2-C-methyl-D-erythritol 4-phosphate cytidylyltransferase
MAATGPATVAAVLVAAGSGERLGAGVPKAFVRVAGRTLLEHAAMRFSGHPSMRQVVVAVPAAEVAAAADLVPGAVVVAGGTTRQQSVAQALAALDDESQLVLVHDVARAFVPVEVVDRVIDALRDDAVDAVVPVVAVTDTIRSCDPDSGALGAVVDRSRLLAMQTPQGFRREVLVAAHARGAALAVTDDVALVEAMGGRVRAVKGDERAFKVTVPLDLALAEAVAAQAAAAGLR